MARMEYRGMGNGREREPGSQMRVFKSLLCSLTWASSLLALTRFPPCKIGLLIIENISL